jgi:hypothetical protein
MESDEIAEDADDFLADANLSHRQVLRRQWSARIEAADVEFIPTDDARTAQAGVSPSLSIRRNLPS